MSSIKFLYLILSIWDSSLKKCDKTLKLLLLLFSVYNLKFLLTEILFTFLNGIISSSVIQQQNKPNHKPLYQYRSSDDFETRCIPQQGYILAYDTLFTMCIQR